jgi:hypothetical protein
MVLGVVVLGLGGFAYSTRDTKKVDKLAATRCQFPPCRASADPVPVRGHEGAYVAADQGNPDHVIITDANVLENTCAWHTTFNRGKDWSEGAFALPAGYLGCRINGPSGGHVPNGSVDLAPSGRVYAVFGSAAAADNKRESVMLAVSTDGGKTFGQAKVAIAPTGPDIGLGRPLMTVAAGPGGKDTLLLSSWSCHPASNPGAAGGTACDKALFARSDDNGDTFTTPVVVNDDPAGQNPSQPAMDKDGAIYETFQRRFADGPVDLFLAKSTDGGKTFAVSQIDRQINIGIQYDAAKIVADPHSGTLYTVWADTRTGRAQIFLRVSTDKGVSWGEKPALLAPDPNYTGSSRSPWISIAPDGRIDVVYYHTSPSPDLQNFDDVYWSYSTDGGSNFFAKQVNDQPIDRTKGYSGPAASMRQLGNHYPPTVSSTDAAAYVVWSDTAAATDVTNTQDTMLRRMEVLGGATPP